MLRYTMRRGINAVITIWLLITLTFSLMHAIPGGPFSSEKKVPAVILENLNRHYHLDESLFQQYARYFSDLFKGDLGPSFRTETRDVKQMLKDGLPVSIQLGLQALIFAIVCGLFLGITAALNHNRWPDRAASVIAVLGTAVPSFVLATLLIQYIAMDLKWLPVATWQTWKHTVLPTVALGFMPLAQVTRMIRSSMLDVLSQDYIKTAKAKGLSWLKIVLRHTFRNAILPVITILGPIAAHLLTGSFVVESIFSVPGAGKLLVSGISNRDYPLILGTTIVYGIALVVMLFLTDVLYTLVDPRIKLAGRKGS